MRWFSLGRVSFASFMLMILSFVVSASLVGWSRYPAEVLRIYDEAVFPRTSIREKGAVPFARHTEIVVKTDDADVAIVVSAKEDLDSTLEGDMVALPEGQHLSVSVDEVAVTIRTRERPASAWLHEFVSRTTPAPKLTIGLPKDFSGVVRVETGSGRVSLRNASLSEFAVKSKSGDVLVTGSDVHIVTIETRSGGIGLDAKAQKVTVETLSGDIEAKLRDAAEALHPSLSFWSKTGAIRVGVHAGASLAVLLETTSGTLESKIPLSGRVESNDRRLAGDVGTGRGTLFARTWSGPLTLEQLPSIER
ncbi:MAG: DUF4097 family beta strand repeat-containing protein [Bdellovibrionota bacterium]